MEAQAEHSAQRAQAVKDYFAKRQRVRELNAQRQEIADRKVALERGVEHLDPELKEQLEATKKEVNAEANRRYEDLRKYIGAKEAPLYQALDGEGHPIGEPEPYLQRIFDVAAGKISDWKNAPAILTKIGDRLRHGDLNVTWSELQDLRSQIGSELQKNLPSDQYAAFKTAMPEIDAAMQKIADENGVGPAQSAARSYYRRYAETFLDRDAVARKALEAPERGGLVKAYRGKDQSGIEQLAQFNPELSRRINAARGYAEEARGIKPAPAKPEPEMPARTAPPEPVQPKYPAPPPRPEFPDRPVQVEPHEQKIGLGDIQAAKEEQLRLRAEAVRHYGFRAAKYAIGLRALVDLWNHRWNLPMDLAAGTSAWAATQFVAGLLESPQVVRLLTRPTVEDIASIPADLRGDLGQLAQQAQENGIKVSPAILTAAAGLPFVTTRTKYLRDLRENGAYTETGAGPAR